MTTFTFTLLPPSCINKETEINSIVISLKLRDGIQHGICFWNNHKVRFAQSAIREMDRLSLDTYDVCAILPDTWDCAISRRAQDTYEQCIWYKGRVIRIVLKLGMFSFDEIPELA